MKSGGTPSTLHSGQAITMLNGSIITIEIISIRPGDATPAELRMSERKIVPGPAKVITIIKCVRRIYFLRISC
jgi:hypothetical protein